MWRSSRYQALAIGSFLAMGLLWLTLFTAIRTAATQSAAFRKAIAPPGVFDEKDPGITRLHDYGAFALYAIDQANAPALSSQALELLAAGDELDMILLDAYPFNGRTEKPVLPDSLRFDTVSGGALQLIQFVGPIKEAWLGAIRASGGIPVHYIANNAYLVWTDDNGRAQLNALVQNSDFLQYSAPYQPHFKLGPRLRPRVVKLNDPTEVVTVTVQMFRHQGQGATEAWLRSRQISQLSPWSPVLAYQNSIVQVRLMDVVGLANRPDTVWIGEYSKPVLTDEVQAQILAGNFNAGQSGPSGPGYLAWLDSYNFSQNPNDYPIVDITDDGIGNGSVNSGDPTLHQFGLDTNPTRLAYIANCTDYADGGGIGGHGHINASIAGGYDTRAGAPYQDSDGYQRGLGVSPYGRFAGTRIFDPDDYDLSSCGNDLNIVIEQSYNNGARISSNSWGCNDCGDVYDPSTQIYDVRTRDAVQSQAGNQELTFVFAAGNSGPSPNTIYQPANGKNVITVGGSENNRAFGYDGCLIGDTEADNAMDIIYFSSQGPAKGGRVKPEIVAPATHIQGTASTNPGYTGATVCDPYRPVSGQTEFAASSGTSHAAPSVAGALSLYTYWLEHTYGMSSPSPALLKSYLLAHPTYLTGLYANDTLPSYAQGFGAPNFTTAFDAVPRLLLDQTGLFDNTGETWSITTSVASVTEPVRIVLAYTDAAGAVGSSNPQVNSLSLRATISGAMYHGNNFSGQWSTPGGVSDLVNNVQAIYLAPGITGTITITVTAQNIAGDGIPNTGDTTDQDFALVCYNCGAVNFHVQVSPTDQSVCIGDDALYDVNVGPFRDFANPVSLSVSGEPAGTTTTLVPNSVTPPGSSQLTIANTIAAPIGDYLLTVTGSSGGDTRSALAWLRLDDTSPGSFTLTSPGDGAVDVAVAPVFNWTASSLANSYFLEVATDIGFSNVVYQAVVMGTSHQLVGTLNRDTLYYWRVRADNGCGSVQSTVFTLRTVPPPPIGSVLLVDGDWGSLGTLLPPFRDVRPSYTSALDALGISYDIYDIEITGLDPNASTIAPYDAVIWFTGDATDFLFGSIAGPDPGSGELVIASYLDGGGCFLISSTEYGSGRGLTSLMTSHLGVAAVANGTYGDTVATGVGPVYGGLGSYSHTASGTTADQFTPDASASIALTVTNGETVGINRDTANYRTSYLGFGLENLGGSGAQDILEAFLTWCGGQTALTIDDTSAIESAGAMTFTVSLTPTISSVDVSVMYTTTNGTALAGSDYISTTGTLIIPAGTISGTISVTLIDDLFGEPDETFTVNLGSAINASISDNSGLGTILDDDPRPDLVLSKTDGGLTAAPGSSIVYTLTHTNTGLIDASGVVITETVPANTVFDAANSPPAWGCNPDVTAGSNCVYAIGTVPAFAGGIVTFTLDISTTILGSATQIDNTAEIGDGGLFGPDPTPLNNVATDVTPLINISRRCALTAGSSYLFNHGGKAVTIDLTNSGDINCIQVDFINSAHVSATATMTDTYYWTIQASNDVGSQASGFTLDLTLPHLSPDISLFPPRPCRYLGISGWSCPPNYTITSSTVTGLGISALSDWIIAYASGPTAVHLSGIRADSSSVLGITLGTGLLGLAAFTIYHRRKSRRRSSARRETEIAPD